VVTVPETYAAAAAADCHLLGLHCVAGTVLALSLELLKRRVEAHLRVAGGHLLAIRPDPQSERKAAVCAAWMLRALIVHST
jgi:hypothetical protein